VTIYYQDFATPLGTLLLTSNRQALTGCYFLGQKHFPASYGKNSQSEWIPVTNDPVLKEAQQIIEDYFRSGVVDCRITLAPQGTEFQRQVWSTLLTIPPGQTRSYSQIAAAMGRPTATRAVAGAIGRNPVSILIPCHRVVGSNGSLTGYAGGIERKQALLRLEGAL